MCVCKTARLKSGLRYTGTFWPHHARPGHAAAIYHQYYSSTYVSLWFRVLKEISDTQIKLKVNFNVEQATKAQGGVEV